MSLSLLLQRIHFLEYCKFWVKASTLVGTPQPFRTQHLFRETNWRARYQLGMVPQARLDFLPLTFRGPPYYDFCAKVFPIFSATEICKLWNLGILPSQSVKILLEMCIVVKQMVPSGLVILSRNWLVVGLRSDQNSTGLTDVSLGRCQGEWAFSSSKRIYRCLQIIWPIK